jgi:SAM-dependent methyltransferase
LDYVYKTSEEYFNYVECQTCNLVFVSPRPTEEEMHKYYPASYSFYREGALDSLKDLVKEAIYQIYFRRLTLLRLVVRTLFYPAFLILKSRGMLNLIRQYRQYPYLDNCEGMRLLDVGCGSGTTFSPFGRKYSLRWLSQRGLTCEGVEVSPKAVEIARTRGLKLHQGYFDRIDLPASSFDIVRMNYSLEHVHSPKSYLKKAYEVLKPGGKLIVSVPNYGGINNLLFPDAVEAPRHLFYFTRKTLQQYLCDLNFIIEKFESDASPEVLMFTLENHPNQAGIVRNDTLMNWLPMYESLAKLGFGDDMTFVARKPLS